MTKDGEARRTLAGKKGWAGWPDGQCVDLAVKEGSEKIHSDYLKVVYAALWVLEIVLIVVLRKRGKSRSEGKTAWPKETNGLLLHGN